MTDRRDLDLIWVTIQGWVGYLNFNGHTPAHRETYFILRDALDRMNAVLSKETGET